MMTLMPQTESKSLIVPPGVSLAADEAISLWHDDVRVAPPGWVWARTNEAAIEVLSEAVVQTISLDHDLGGHNLDPYAPDTWLYKGPSTEATGLELVDWMIAHSKVPDTVYIHSWNAPGASRMYKTFVAKGYLNVFIRPYEPPAKPICDRCGEPSCWRAGGSGGCVA